MPVLAHWSRFAVDVIECLESGTIDAGMMEISAVLQPMMTLTLIVVIGLTVALGFANFATEKKYQTIISKVI